MDYPNINICTNYHLTIPPIVFLLSPFMGSTMKSLGNP